MCVYLQLHQAMVRVVCSALGHAQRGAPAAAGGRERLEERPGVVDVPCGAEGTAPTTCPELGPQLDPVCGRVPRGASPPLPNCCLSLNWVHGCVRPCPPLALSVPSPSRLSLTVAVPPLSLTVPPPQASATPSCLGLSRIQCTVGCVPHPPHASATPSCRGLSRIQCTVGCVPHPPPPLSPTCPPPFLSHLPPFPRGVRA